VSNQPRLEQMLLNPAGTKMVTTERRSGNVSAGSNSLNTSGAAGESNDTIVMKFWTWSTHTRTFILNTRIDPPHSHSSQHLSLSTLLWHPTENMVVTIGKVRNRAHACIRSHTRARALMIHNGY
jgi:hypothetical protein